VKDKFRFSDQIINNGNSLILVSIEREKFYFVVNHPILGYSVDEVMGMLFWEVTEDEEFIGENFMKILFLKTFIRKLKTKVEYKHIEWHDKKYTEDLIIGMAMR
jgi:hypothetical protein